MLIIGGIEKSGTKRNMSLLTTELAIPHFMERAS